MLIKYTTIKYHVSGQVYHLQSIKKRVLCDCNLCSSSSHSHESQFLSPVKTNENVFLSNKKKKRKEKQTMEEQKKNYARIACLTYSTSSSCLLLLFLLLLLVAAVLNLRKMAQRNKLKCSKSRRRCRASFHSATSYHTHTQGQGKGKGKGVPYMAACHGMTATITKSHCYRRRNKKLQKRKKRLQQDEYCMRFPLG